MTDQCDESKCLSTGLMPTGTDPLMFNCYAQGPGTLYPYICADNYVGIEVANDDVATTADPKLKYYTCCPSDDDDITTTSVEGDPTSTMIQPERHCENPQDIDDSRSNSWNVTSMCEVDTPSYPYGREMTFIPGLPKGYMCCDKNLSPPLRSQESYADSPSSYSDEYNNDGNFTDDYSNYAMGDDNYTMGDDNPKMFLGGIPPKNIGGGYDAIEQPPQCYPSMFCGNCVVENTFGDLQAMNCYNDVYRFPQVTSVSGNTAQYQCCSTQQDNNSTSNGSFVTDSSAFKATVWTQFTLALIASMMSLVIIYTISVSLYQKHKPTNNKNSRARRRPSGPDYSTYNLYLVFLAIPDLIYNLFMLGIVSDNYQNGWIPANDALISACATVNMYMNVIIAYEVMILLRRTKNCQRYTPPSYKKASIQFGVVTVYAITIAMLWFWLLNYFASTYVRATVAIPLQHITVPIFYVFVFIIPTVALLWICFCIWKEKLLPPGQVKIGNRKIPTSSTVPSSQGTNSQHSRKLWSKGPSSRNVDNTKSKGDEATSNNKNTTGGNGISNNGDSTTATNNNNSHGHDNGDITTVTPHKPVEAATYNRTVGGRLNILAMYFLRIIMVFFLIW